MLNKLRRHAYFQFSANQITWSRLLIQIYILNDKLCRSRYLSLTLVLLNKLRCHAYFQFSANQITWSRLLIQIYILNDKLCRSRYLSLTLVLLNKLRCHAYFQFSANQITWSSLFIRIHILNGKQCRYRSVGFFRSQLIRIYTVSKDRVYLGSAGLGLIKLIDLQFAKAGRIRVQL